MLLYFFLGIQNLGYLIASTYYHPLAAFHRWLTVASVLPGLVHMSQFFFYFPDERNQRTARVFLFSQYAIFIVVNVIFFIVSFQAGRIFHFDGHYWDFDLDFLSYIISIIIMAQIVFIIAIGIWRIVVTDKSNKLPVLYMLLCFMIITVIPGIANSLSREGTFSRDTFQIIWELVTVLGFFLTVTVYINITKNRTTVMVNIVGISLVTFLLVFQGLSYFNSLDSEEAYDNLQIQKLARIIIDNSYHPEDLSYFLACTKTSEKCTPLRFGKIPSLTGDIRYELANTLIYDKINQLSDKNFFKNMLDIVAGADHYFEGYRRSIYSFMQSLPPEKQDDKKLVMRHIDGLHKLTAYHTFKINHLPEKNFRSELLGYLKKTGEEFIHFNRIISSSIEESSLEEGELKEEIKKYLIPLQSPELRLYRHGTNGEHYVSFLHTDIQKSRIYESGYSYTSYRKYIEPSAKHLIYLLGLVIFILLVVFPIFFRGALMSPLKALLEGVRMVNLGKLDVVVPLKVEDEIGFLSAAFNSMVASVRMANEEIDSINHYFKNIIDSMPSVLVSVDAEGRVTHWNIAAEKKTGKKEDDVKGLYLGDVFPQLEQYIEQMHLAISTKEPQKLEKIIYHDNNEIVYSDLIMYPLVADGVKGAVIRMDDITPRVRLEEMMIHTEKMMSVGGLAAGMAHEINNPLGGMLIAAQNVQRRLSPELDANIAAARKHGIKFDALLAYLQEREILKMLDGMREMGERASKTVNNMLNFSRRSDSHMDMIDICEIMDKTVELAASDYDLKKSYDFRHIEIIRDYAENLPPIECAVVEIQQVLLNLLKNAAQAIHVKKYVTGENPRIIIRLRKEAASIRIEIDDNGAGMSEELRKRIFEPFFTTKEAGIGTGLGLSVSYFIITNNHQGTISVESFKNKGTKFIIHIPIMRLPI